MNKNNKKGFTLTELVIVIVIIAILAAVLIPTYTGLVNRAKDSNDTNLVKLLNDALINAEVEEQPENMQDAIEVLDEVGYKVPSLQAKASKNTLVWNQFTNRFYIYSEGEVDVRDAAPDPTKYTCTINGVKKSYDLTDEDYLYTFWVISDTVNETFSTYYTGTDETINTSKGFDAGSTTSVKAINYTNDGNKQDVVIRSNSASTTLNVYAPNDDVKHYGDCGTVNVRSAKDSSYHEYGKVAFMEVNKGHVVIENGASVDLMYAAPAVYEVNNSGDIVENTTATAPAVLVTNNGAIDHAHTTIEAATSVNEKAINVVFDYDGRAVKTGETTTIDHSDTSASDPWNVETGAEKAISKLENEENYDTSVRYVSSTETKYMSLVEFATLVNEGNDCANCTITLMSDVDLSGIDWTPIGKVGAPFRGVFDGNGHTISNLTCVNGFTGTEALEGKTLNGLFGLVDGNNSNLKYTKLSDVWSNGTWSENNIAITDYSTQIKNVTIENINLSTDKGKIKTYFGGIAGTAFNAYFYNCKVVSGTLSGDAYLGGIVGYMSSSIVKSCSTGTALTITVAGDDGRSDGGIVGSVENRGATTNATASKTLTHCNAIIDCTNNANISSTITADGPVAGILGMAQSYDNVYICSPVVNCVNNGSITMTDNTENGVVAARIAGIIGQTQNAGLVYNCANNGNLTYIRTAASHSLNTKSGEAQNNVEIAGVAGYCSLAVEIVNCSNTGSLQGPANYMGGVISQAWSLTTSECVNTGVLTNTISPSEFGKTSDLIASSDRTFCENGTFNTVSDLYNTIKDLSGEVYLKNVTVNDKSGSLQVPAGITTLKSDNKLAYSLDLSLASKAWHKVEVPDEKIELNNDLSGVSFNICGTNNTVSVGTNGKVSYIGLAGAGTTFVNNGTVGTLSINSSIASTTETPVVNNGTITYSVGFTGNKDNAIYFTNNVGKTIGSADYKGHTVITQSCVKVVINNKGTIVGSKGYYTLLFYGNSEITFNAYDTSTLVNNGYTYVNNNGAGAHGMSCVFNVEEGAAGTTSTAYYRIATTSSKNYTCSTTVNLNQTFED